MSEKKEVQVIPFHAINEFMRDDYRLLVLQEVFTNLAKGTPEQRAAITKLFANGVKLPGFRNSSLAPLPIKIKNSMSVFERSAEFTANVLEVWSNLHSELKENMVDILSEKGWEPQPVNVDRSLLPGFLIDWPKTDTFEVLINAVRAKKADIDESDDNISLMAVWVGNRLPYNLFTGDEEKQEGS
jgi:hypothetical protein